MSASPTSASKHYVLALLYEEPAGRIFTRNAGAISFEATLYWHPDDGVPSGPILDDPIPGVRFFSLVETEDVTLATRRISCEIRALYAEQLTAGLDAALRSVTTHAARTEAVLEWRTVRLADPLVAPAVLVEELARQLWDAGLSVSFGPSWAPTAGATISVGAMSLEDALESFLRASHALWMPCRSR